MWRDVEGYRGYYEVSSEGLIRNRRTGRRLRMHDNGRGYLKVSLSKRGKVKKHCVHKIVTRAFLGNNPRGWVVDHINRNKLDNRAINLRYVTRSQNCSNRASAKGSSSQYLGVSWCSGAGHWVSRIQHEGQRYYLGCYHNEDEAAWAYNIKSLELKGEHGAINEIAA